MRAIQTKHSNDIGKFKRDRMSRSPPGGSPFWGSPCVFNTCEHTRLYKSDPAHLVRVVCVAAPQVRSWPVRTHPRALQPVLSLSCRAEAGVVGPCHRPAGSCLCIYPRPEPASRGVAWRPCLQHPARGLHNLWGERARGVSCCQAARGGRCTPS